jgi:uncharacterized protein (DUF433 family)
MNVWDIPIYNPAYAGKLVNLSPGRVKRWLQGYNYSYISGEINIITGHKGPVIKRPETELPNYATFLDLIDLLFVKQFLNYGISLQRIRKALNEAEQLIGGNHFAQRSFFTDGKNIYMQVKNYADALLELLSSGHWVISEFIKELAHQIDFDEPSGFARRWFPLGPEGLVVLDPKISFGKPTIIGKNIPTASIFDFYLGERNRVNKVCEWLNISKEEVYAAINFESNLIAA